MIQGFPLGTIERLLRWALDTIIQWSIVFWFCIILDWLGAMLGGLFWYGPMLQESPIWALPFIPDCPLAALVGSIALLGMRAKKQWTCFNAFVAFGCMKYGAWTICFWLREWMGSGTIAPIEMMLFVTHIGLFIQGLLFVPHLFTLSFPKRFVVIGWFALSIYVDYGLGFAPPRSPNVTLSFVFWLATVLTVALGVGLLLLPYHETKHV